MSGVNKTIKAEFRNEAGKGVARSLRRGGRIPAIIYGGGQKEVTISLDLKELDTEYQRGHFTSKIYYLEAGKDKFRVLPVQVQVHPVTDIPEHVDFMHVAPGAHIKVKVKVVFSNAEKSPGLKRGGVLNIVRHDVELICPEDKIPTRLAFDLDGMVIGDSLHISNTTLPEGARPVISDRDFTIATIVGRTKEEDEQPVAGAVAGAAEATAGGADAEKSSGDDAAKK